MADILVVVAVDSQAYSMALCDFLQQLPDITVFAAQDGAETLRLVEDMKPYLLILDIHVPHMTGWDVLQQLQDTAAPVHILVLASYAAIHSEERALNGGACAYVPKGNIQLLVDTLQQLLSA